MQIAFCTKLMLKLFSKLRILKYFNIYPKICLGKKSIKLPIMGGIGCANLLPSEPWLDKIIDTLFHIKGGAFIDVGINIGQTLIKFIEYGDDRNYYGFEPNYSCSAYVEKIKNINNLQEVNIIPVGLSDHNSLDKLCLSDDYDSCASTTEGFRKQGTYSMSKQIPMFRGDLMIDYFGIKSVCILKIDVEGGEFEVLVGLQNTIKTLKPFIICEILPIYDSTSELGKFRRHRTDQVIETLVSKGYRIFRLLHDGKVISLKTIETHSDLKLCEYLFVPSEYIDTVMAQLNLIG